MESKREAEKEGNIIHVDFDEISKRYKERNRYEGSTNLTEEQRYYQNRIREHKREIKKGWIFRI